MDLGILVVGQPPENAFLSSKCLSEGVCAGYLTYEPHLVISLISKSLGFT
jgi:hypothetical protein